MLRGSLALGVVMLTAPVHAHGGFAETHSFTARPGHPEELFAGFTQGALLSHDRGQTWRWVCAEAMGYGSWLPESYTWLANGTLLTATGNALVRSRDGGCTWSAAPDFGDLWVTSLATHPTRDTVLYATTGRPARTNALYQSEDSGETWTPTGLRLEAVLSSVRGAPSDPQRLYVGGAKGYAPYVFRSDDAGGTWRELPLALPTSLAGAYDLKLLAVSPARADVLWVRVSSLSATGSVRHTVLRSDDGGLTFAPVLEQDDPLVNMDVSEDGRTTWVATYNHLYRGREGEGFTLLPLPTGNACVTRAGDGLYACGSTWVHEWALARSSDEGASWQPLLSLRDVRGVHACPAGTPVAERCPALWPQLAAQLGVTVTPDPSDAGTGGPSEPVPAPRSGCEASAGSALPLSWLGLLGLRRMRGAAGRAGMRGHWMRGLSGR